MVEHFYHESEDRIRDVFITPGLAAKYNSKRFGQKRTKSIEFTANQTDP